LRGAQIAYLETICLVRSALPHRAGQASFQGFKNQDLKNQDFKNQIFKRIAPSETGFDGPLKGLCCCAT